jgi:hypothetical protein
MPAVWIYSLVAVMCWSVPLSLSDGKGTEIINVYPMRMLGVVSILLAVANWILSLRSRVALVAAVSWSVATLAMSAPVAVLAAGPTRAGLVQSLLHNLQSLGATLSALMFVAETIQVLRIPQTPRVSLFARGAIVVGLLLLAGACGWLVVRGFGLFGQSGTALEAAASDAATLWLALLSSSMALGVGLVLHGLRSKDTANSRAV